MLAPSLESYVFLFILSLSVSSLLVPVLRAIAFRFAILDKPNQAHKTHEESVPYLGGLSIIVPIVTFSFIGPLVFAELFDFRIRMALLMIPAVLLSVIGLYDDIRNMSAFSRLFAQTLVSIGMTLFLQQLGYSVQIFNNPLVDFLFSTFWLVGITNAFNFIDNLDGGAAGLTSVASLTLFILCILGGQYLIASLSLALAGSSLGFLLWNRYPARIYLGDSGALFLGFLLAQAILQYDPQVESRLVSALIPVLILAIPIIDTTVAVVGRLFRGISIFQGGRDHLSHRLLSIGLNKNQSGLTLWGLASIFSLLSILAVSTSTFFSIIVSLVGVILIALLIVWFMKIEIND
jgi:UDP-GlcNAc:undecaprenyl-phosphate GlcNAc-1-phosphate transferase